MKNELTDYERNVLMALCDTDVKFDVKVVLGMQTNEKLNCIFKIDDKKWGIVLLDSKKIEIFDDLMLACYKIIKHSVKPEIVDFVLNYFNNALIKEREDSSFLDYTSVKKKEKVKIGNKY